MAEQAEAGTSADAAVVSDAFLAARQLLEGAEREAEQRRAEVDRYVRQREQEAEMLVAKARRLLTMAEERAASLAAGNAPDLVAPAPSPGEADADVPAAADRPAEATGLDGILNSAITRALNQAFPPLG